MIKANELRIGNWYTLIRGKGHIDIQMDGATIGEIFSMRKEYALNDFEPIPITPEVLEACEFIYNEAGEYWHLNGSSDPYEIHKMGANFFVCHESAHPDLVYISVYYLHQLQNLYFALTGEELIYKP